MAKYRKKPVVIEAEQWQEVLGIEGSKEHHLSVGHFRNPKVSDDKVCKLCSRTMFYHGWVDTLEGGHIVCPGDWIITGVKGERYPCKPDIFEATYEAVMADNKFKDINFWTLVSSDGWIPTEEIWIGKIGFMPRADGIFAFTKIDMAEMAADELHTKNTNKLRHRVVPCRLVIGDGSHQTENATQFPLNYFVEQSK